eukprot:gene41648-56373_t
MSTDLRPLLMALALAIAAEGKGQVWMTGTEPALFARRGCYRANAYLAVRVTPGAATDLDDAVAGAAAIGDGDYPDWGFHVVDLQIVEGDLIGLVRRQGEAWYGRR